MKMRKKVIGLVLFLANASFVQQVKMDCGPLETLAACSGGSARTPSHRLHRYQIGGAVADSAAPIAPVECPEGKNDAAERLWSNDLIHAGKPNEIG